METMGRQDQGDAMTAGRIVQSDMDIKKILEQTRSIAVVGLSPKPDRDSYRVADYLQQHRYNVIPVRPAQKEILGAKAYPSLTDIKEPIDIVDVFRRSDQIMPHVEEAIRIKARVFWMQLGIENAEAASLLTQAGIDVVMDRCIKIEHDRLFS
jgi:predicted CoA-binding protein